MTKRTKRIAALAVITAVAGVSLTGCMDKYTEPFQDAPRSGTVNRQPADIIEMPDGFSNLSTKCDHGNRVYVVYHGDNKYGAPAVAPNDPSCAGR